MKRKRIAFCFLLFLIIFVISGCSKRESDKKIVVLTFGGSFAEAQRKAYFEPFEKETGIDVVEASYNGEYGKLKAMVQSRNVTWDVVDIEASALIRGISENLYLLLDYNKIDTSTFIQEGVSKYAIATDLYSVSFGYNTTYFAEKDLQPKNWQDFWDIVRFPGPRCMKKDPRFTLEIALLADGVPIEKVYENGRLDLDRAFKSLDKIKPYIKVWWTAGHQPIQLLADGEVAMAAAFGARMWIAQYKENKPINMTWNQGIIDPEYWAVLRGAKNPDLSMKFISFASRPTRQAEFPKYFPLGPANIKAYDFIEQEVAKTLNTYPENLKKQVFFNAKWWSEHEDEVTEKWNAWLIK